MKNTKILAGVVIVLSLIVVVSGVFNEKKSIDIDRTIKKQKQILTSDTQEGLKGKKKRDSIKAVQKKQDAQKQQIKTISSELSNQDEVSDDSESIFSLPIKMQDKAFYTAEEKEQVMKHYSNQETINEAYLTLVSKKNLVKGPLLVDRLKALNYLVKGMSLEQNPKKEDLAEKLKYFILHDHFQNISDITVRKMVFGDKYEALKALRNHYPETYYSLVSKHDSKHLQKLIAYDKRRRK